MPYFDLRVVEARLLPRTTMSGPTPYVLVECGGTKVSTPVVKMSTINPTWDCAFKFQIFALDAPLIITVMNEGQCCSDDEQLSTMKLDLTKLGLIQGKVREDWFNFPHQEAGIRLRILAHDFGFPQEQVQPQMLPPQQQMMMMQQPGGYNPYNQPQQSNYYNPYFNQQQQQPMMFGPPPPPPVQQQQPQQPFVMPGQPQPNYAFQQPGAPILGYGI